MSFWSRSALPLLYRDWETRESCHYSLITHLAHFMHIISKALEDGQIDKSEAKVIRHMLPGIKAVIHAFEGSL